MAKDKKPKPFHSQRTSPHTLPGDDVVETIKSILDAGMEEEFLALCREKKITVRITPRSVNLIKDFLFESRAHKASATLRVAVKSARCPQ